MKYLAALLALALVASNTAWAEVDKSFRAYVVSVDTAADSITLKFAKDDKGTAWQELTAKWDDRSRWENGEKNEYKPEAATAALARSLKEGTKVYVNVIDTDNSGKWHLEKLRTMPAASTVP